MSEAILESLNQQQKEAVLHNEGPLLILAGAGTGKTRVLTSRMAYIIHNHLASPFQILAVTFTNKATNEMKDRVSNLIYSDVSNLWIGTFHSMATKILRRHCEIVGLKPGFTIIDPDDQKRLLKQIMEDFKIDIKEFPPKNFSHKINEWKDKGYVPKYVKNSDCNQKYFPNIRDIYSTYQDRLKKLNVCDFGDLLLYNVEIFRNHPNILDIYLDKFRYVLVDEYQDTNTIQHSWLKLISGLGRKPIVNICCVGDDDQSIYGWRGAEIENILRFEKDYKNAKVIRLERNYRSTGNILETASALITNNDQRHNKTLWTDNKNKGEKVFVLCYADGRNEAYSIASEIQKIKNDIVKYKDIAVLVRAGYQTRLFEEIFMSNAIPYKIIGGLKFYERREIRDCIAYLRLIKNPADALAFERVVNVPKRGIGSSTLNKIFAESKKTDLSFIDSAQTLCDFGVFKGKIKETLLEFIELIAKWHQLVDQISHTELAHKALEEFGYFDYLNSEKTDEARGRVENIDEFIRSLEEFENLGEFLEYISLVSDKDTGETRLDSVNIMTMHGAKGLEFDTVFAPGWEEGIFPSPRSVEDKNKLEEERRLAYVAITRAKKKLYISYAMRRYTFGEVRFSLPSRFLMELPENNIIKVNKGVVKTDNEVLNYVNNLENRENDTEDELRNFFDRKKKRKQYQLTQYIKNAPSPKKTMAKIVHHDIFGDGVILAEADGKYKVAFKNKGVKTILKSFVRIKEKS